MSNSSRLKKNEQFRTVFGEGRKIVASSLVVFLRTRTTDIDHGMRFGIVASKKVGNAVERNRIKRRLRAVLQTQEDPAFRAVPCDVVVVARRHALSCCFEALESCFSASLKKARAAEGAPIRGFLPAKPV